MLKEKLAYIVLRFNGKEYNVSIIKRGLKDELREEILNEMF